MNEEEPAPAWRAELGETARRSLGCYTEDEVLAAIRPHIEAAERRGRQTALREAADDFTADAWRSDEQRKTEILGGVAYLLRVKADAVSPDKEKP